MLRAFLVGVCRFLLSAFFRRIEVVGRENLPQDGSLLFALNHPNALIDPLFILCLSGRRVSFLAKEPLFRMPLISIFVRAFESLPVYRTSDGADPANNRKMMRAAADLLTRGNALALFPEGTTHSDPTLKRFRSGAARIALSARALGDTPVRIVPAALYYEKKESFRSRAVLAFGEPILVPVVTLDENGESPRDEGARLTETLQEAVSSIMPTSDTAEGLVLAENAERIFSAALRDTPNACPKAAAQSDEASEISLATRMSLRRKMIDAYLRLLGSQSEKLADLVTRIEELEAALASFGLNIDAAPQSPGTWRKKRLPRIFQAVLLFPLALPGIILHFPAYFLVRFLTLRYGGETHDVIATSKLMGGMLFFPLTWLSAAGALAYSQSRPLLILLGLLGPLLMWAGVTFMALLGSVTRSIARSRGAARSGLDWQAIQKTRATIAEEIAALIQ